MSASNTNKNASLIGRVHSIETMGALDGPGLRTVAFLQGCPLRCKYCHNVDSTLTEGGTDYTVEALANELLKNRAYWEQYEEPAKVADAGVAGGVTISGGDPVFQPDFLTALVRRLKQEDIHVAVDTSLMTQKKVLDGLIPLVDLWMISIKEFDSERHRQLTGVSNERIQANICYLDDQITTLDSEHKPQIRHRYVLIPELTDSEEMLRQLGEHCSSIQNLESLELLPYSSLGRHKWIKLYDHYALDHVRDANAEDLGRATDILESYGFALKW